MNKMEKQSVIIGVTLLIGLVIVVLGYTEVVHDKSIEILKPLYEQYAGDRTEQISGSIGYFVQLLICVMLMFTPFAGISSIWFFRIAYNLVLGRHADVNVFIVAHGFNYVMAILSVILGFYSIYSMYRWSQKLTDPLPAQSDEQLIKFI